MAVEQYFGVERKLMERIQELFPDFTVLTPFSVEDMLQAVNDEYSISIIYHDDRIADNSNSGTLNSCYQQWLVVLSLRDAQAQLQQTNTIRSTADPLIKKLLQGLQGFDPKLSGYRYFKRANCPVRQGSQSSFAYFPFLFEIQMFI